MNKIFLISTFLLFAFLSYAKTSTNPGDTKSGQLLAKDVFINITTSEYEILKKDNRLDMCDYYTQADSIWHSPNELGGTSHIDTLTTDFCKVKISDASSLTIRLLPQDKKDSIVAIINTIYGPAADSSLSFVNSSLEPLPTKKYFTQPKLKDFFDLPKGCLTTMDEIENMIGFTAIEYSINPESTDLIARLSIGDYINQDDYNIIKIFLIDKLAYKWDGKKYKQVK